MYAKRQENQQKVQAQDREHNMNTKKSLRIRRKYSIRKKIRGTADRPRLAVFRSNAMMYVQIIDDDARKTLVSAYSKGNNVASAGVLGKDIAALAKKQKITRVVFDRGGFAFHGAVKALADAVRAEGLVV